MKIAICASAYFIKEATEIKRKLEEKGHKVLIFPEEVILKGKRIRVTEFYRLRKEDLYNQEYWDLKNTLMKEHFNKISESDAILVLNFDRDGIEGYIGGNTLIEMGIAMFLQKKIFLWKEPSSKLPYYEEIMSMKPIIINGDINRIG